MKKLNSIPILLIPVFLSATLLLSGCVLADGVKGNGKLVSEAREIPGFDKIDVGGAFNVFLKQGNDEYLKLEVEENLMDLVVTKVVAGRLKIYCKESVEPTEDMNVYLTFKDLSELDISGACELKNENTLKLNELDLDASGASEIMLNLTADYLDADFSGASEIELTGKVGKMDVNLSGASELNAYDLETDFCDITVSGAGDARLFVNKELEAEVSGAADIRYRGNASVSSKVSGAGSIRKN